MWLSPREMTDKQLANEVRGIKNLNFSNWSASYDILEETAQRLERSTKDVASKNGKAGRTGSFQDIMPV